MSESGLSASDVLAMRNNGDWGDNGIMWLIAIMILCGNGGFFNNGYQPQYATQDFVQNGFNFNDLQSQNRDILGAINNAVTQNISVSKDIENQLQMELGQIMAGQQAIAGNLGNCCGQTLRLIESKTAEINANTTAQTQKILDAIAGNRMADMQNQINQLQLQQAMSGVVRYPDSFAYNAGSNPFCNCGNGCCNR